MKLLPESFATQRVDDHTEWRLYRIREWILYIGRVRGRRDYRLIHSDNRIADIFTATRKPTEDPSSPDQKPEP